MARVRVYTKVPCSFCRAAKQLLERKGVVYEEIDVTHDDDARVWLRQVSGQATIPQIFIGERSVGGYSDLVELDQRGELDALLNKS